jgi:hypothetical protein
MPLATVTAFTDNVINDIILLNVNTRIAGRH